MIVTLKTLKQHTFKIEIDGSDSVRTFKERIEASKGNEFPANCQKLIYAGKILNDDNKMSEYDIDEKKFVVIMVTKPQPGLESNSAEPASSTPVAANSSKPSPSASSSTTTSATETVKSSSGDDSSKTMSEVKPPESLPNESSESNVPPASVEGLDISAAESTLVLGEDYQKMVNQIIEMGYEKDEVERALRASFNNPDRAVEYLISGTVPSEQEVADVANPAADGSNNSSSLNIPSDSPGGPLAFLRNQPQFQQIRQVVRQNPQLLNTVLQQIGQNNPQLLHLISQNQEDFVGMINEPAGSAQSDATIQGSSPLESSLAHATAHITPLDKEAIERLKALGFPEYLVVQAYFACEKNENLAANFLLSQNFD